MGTDGACSKAEHHNSEGKWEALTSFDKKKQIRTGGKVQGAAPINLNSKILKFTMPASNNRGLAKRGNFHEELAKYSETNEDREEEKERS